MEAMATPTGLVEPEQPNTTENFEDLMARVNQAINQNQTPAVMQDITATQIGIKLDGTNYALWSQIVEMFISGKDKLGYINGDFPQPEPAAPSFRRWRTKNSVVWDSIATTYFDGTDASQVYDLKRRVTRMKQSGEPIETYYNCLQGVWRELDFRRPNPMECVHDIQKYNTLLQEDIVYTFLDGLDDKLDKIRSDVLQLKPFPSVEQAYAYVRREDIKQTIMLSNNGTIPAATMISRGMRNSSQNQFTLQVAKPGNSSSHGGKLNFSKAKGQTEGGSNGCSYCGNMKHTRETCFKLHSYPEWWTELKARKSKESAGGTGRAAMVNAEYAGVTGRTAMDKGEQPVTKEPELSLAPLVNSNELMTAPPGNQGNNSSALLVSKGGDNNDWIVDSGATDHMTFCPEDIVKLTEPRRTSIFNANGVMYPVTGAGTVDISPSISLPNTLLVPSLSSKLLSVGQATEELNCVALMYPQFCLFQDILTKEIIGRGTKREGLYYMDDFSSGRVNTPIGVDLMSGETEVTVAPSPAAETSINGEVTVEAEQEQESGSPSLQSTSHFPSGNSNDNSIMNKGGLLNSSDMVRHCIFPKSCISSNVGKLEQPSLLYERCQEQDAATDGMTFDHKTLVAVASGMHQVVLWKIPGAGFMVASNADSHTCWDNRKLDDEDYMLLLARWSNHCRKDTLIQGNKADTDVLGLNEV
ncbi:hypothetical protein POTOM_004435 [Populus tomentosa]|uniref:Retrotransposon Copia-like N-terminal domain-containing protein n=1 Tax=Populus tomentosa TaxID=118781 RepID=A0A8X8AJT8_POPTO|nr:hypothetical protein POTOM_004435 [Populus tomentosa]